MRLYNPFIKVETKENAGLVISGVLWSRKCYVDNTGKDWQCHVVSKCGNEVLLSQVEEGHQIQFNLDYFMLPCPTQSIKVRDGKDAWMSELIGEFTGRGVNDNGNVVSSGNLVLIDFHLNDSQILNNACYAGFIGHVQLIGKWPAVRFTEMCCH